MKNKTTRFIISSLIILSVLCICIFSVLAVYMNGKSKTTIDEVGSVYMKGVSEQISMHFQSTMDLRLSQLEYWYTSDIAGHENDAPVRETFAVNARARGYDALAFYYGGENLDMVYGDGLKLENPDEIERSFRREERRISVGKTTDGKTVALMGIPSKNTGGGENACKGLIAAMDMDYLSRTFSLEQDDTLVYSHIILHDGSFVLRSADEKRDNYFDRIRDADTPNEDIQTAYIENLKTAMQNGEDYTGEFPTKNEMRRMYCTPLAYSDWYLVTVMPYGMLNQSLNGLSRSLILSALGSCGVLLIVFVAIFFIYFRLTRIQMKEIEKAREEAIHATKAKSEFLSNMSHDIRTPMNAIVGMTAIATANIDNKDQVKNCLKKITLSSRHLLGLINDVLDMSKIESGKMTLNMDRISLREIMDGIVNIAQPQVKAKGQQFDVLIQDISCENVYSDSVRLNQVLLNLVSNAVKFTPDGGSIRITMYQEPSDMGGNYVKTHIIVKDTGIGMSPNFLKIVFESYAREDIARVKKTEGAGLGMAITKYIVDAMGGTIDVQSRPGRGSEFHVTIDFEKATEDEKDMLLPNWNMLVVDDDEQLCRSTVDSLDEIGVNAEWTLDGESALDMVAKRRAENNDYHVILLDWKLPGMDGVETAREIRKHAGGDVPILLISAYDWSEIEDDARDAGVTGFISKPLFKSTLYYGLKKFADIPDGGESEKEYKISFEGKKVLMAEDNELNWEIASELLSDLGMELDWAQNGQICLDKFRSSPEHYYDAVLMDIRMPVMSGYDATKAIRAEQRSDSDIPIIAMTADAFAEDIRKCLECGMNAHIAKPIDIREVAKLLKKHMKEK